MYVPLKKRSEAETYRRVRLFVNAGLVIALILSIINIWAIRSTFIAILCLGVGLGYCVTMLGGLYIMQMGRK